MFDSFNQRHLSDHRTLANALKARIKHAKQWRKGNGVDAFVQYKILKSDGTQISRNEEIEAQIAAGIY